MNNKSALSPVVATVLVIMLTILAVTILFTFILPTVRDNLDEIAIERVELSIETDGGHTVWDSDLQIATVKIKRGNDNQKLEKIIFRFYEGVRSVHKDNTRATPPETVPEKGQTKTYEFELGPSGITSLSFVTISAIVAGIEQEISDETGDFTGGTKISEASSSKKDENTNKYSIPICTPVYNETLKAIEISSCFDLQCMLQNLTANYTLVGDIDCNGFDNNGDGKGFEPVGNCGNGNCTNDDEDPFTGTFNGNDFTIVGLFINRSDENVTGLFGFTYGAKIFNLNSTGNYINGGHCVGGIVGASRKSNFTNNFIEGVVNSTVHYAVDGWPDYAKMFCEGSFSGCSTEYLSNENAQSVTPKISDWGCINGPMF